MLVEDDQTNNAACEIFRGAANGPRCLEVCDMVVKKRAVKLRNLSRADCTATTCGLLACGCMAMLCAQQLHCGGVV